MFLAHDIQLDMRLENSLTLLHDNPINSALLRRLLGAGLFVDSLDNNGRSPIFHAIRLGGLPSVKLLIEVRL